MMKLFRVKTKKGVENVGGKDEEDARQAFSHIYPHLKILKVKEVKEAKK